LRDDRLTYFVQFAGLESSSLLTYYYVYVELHMSLVSGDSGILGRRADRIHTSPLKTSLSMVIVPSLPSLVVSFIKRLHRAFRSQQSHKVLRAVLPTVYALTTL
jgi:hypothetical protein